jgi:hypothetical protein
MTTGRINQVSVSVKLVLRRSAEVFRIMKAQKSFVYEIVSPQTLSGITYDLFSPWTCIRGCSLINRQLSGNTAPNTVLMIVTDVRREVKKIFENPPTVMLYVICKILSSIRYTVFSQIFFKNARYFSIEYRLTLAREVLN